MVSAARPLDAVSAILSNSRAFAARLILFTSHRFPPLVQFFYITGEAARRKAPWEGLRARTTYPGCEARVLVRAARTTEMPLVRWSAGAYGVPAPVRTPWRTSASAVGQVRMGQWPESRST